jgi:hypothetical protein
VRFVAPKLEHDLSGQRDREAAVHGRGSASEASQTTFANPNAIRNVAKA